MLPDPPKKTCFFFWSHNNHSETGFPTGRFSEWALLSIDMIQILGATTQPIQIHGALLTFFFGII